MKLRMAKNYTLVELMVVIAIIGILMSIAMPAFNRLTQGNKVTAAARNLSTAISQARSLAILQRKYVALLLPMYDATLALPEKYLYKSYRLCYITKTQPSTYNFAGWTEDGIWRLFPEGAIIADVDQTQGWLAGTSPAFNGLQDVTFSINKCGDIDSTYAGRPATDLITLKCLIFTPFGNLVGTDVFISVTEGTTSTNTAMYTNRNADNTPANLIEMKIAAFTGRLSFL